MLHPLQMILAWALQEGHWPFLAFAADPCRPSIQELVDVDGCHIGATVAFHL